MMIPYSYLDKLHDEELKRQKEDYEDYRQWKAWKEKKKKGDDKNE